MNFTHIENNLLCLDLDETLVSSLYANNEKHADQLIDIYSQYWEGVKFSLFEGECGWDLGRDYWYVSFLRKWSKELIQYFQLTLGIENVCIVSWGTQRYVLDVVKRFDLNIPPSNIYGREDLGSNVPRLRNKNIVLLDNENYEYHRSGLLNKVNFLDGLERDKLVQVTNFDVRYFQEGLDITLDELIKKIENAFKISL